MCSSPSEKPEFIMKCPVCGYQEPVKVGIQFCPQDHSILKNTKIPIVSSDAVGALPLNQTIRKKILQFLEKQDMPALYKSYAWNNDIFANGFPEIFRLETKLIQTARQNFVLLEDIVDIAYWGGLVNPSNISAETERIRVDQYDSQGQLFPFIYTNPDTPLTQLANQTEGLGPTYLSKVLRFAVPREFGAIDSRLVRVFGRSRRQEPQHNWLKLTAHTAKRGASIRINKSVWPSEYRKWIFILRTFVNQLNFGENPIPCPHPKEFKKSKIRTKNHWACADVEMALFAYASKIL